MVFLFPANVCNRYLSKRFLGKAIYSRYSLIFLMTS